MFSCMPTHTTSFVEISMEAGILHAMRLWFRCTSQMPWGRVGKCNFGDSVSDAMGERRKLRGGRACVIWRLS